MNLFTQLRLLQHFADLLIMASVMTLNLLLRKSARGFPRTLLLCGLSCSAACFILSSVHADQRQPAGTRLRPVSSMPVANRLIFAPATQTGTTRTANAAEPAEQQNPLQPQPTPEIDDLQKRKQQTLDELHDKAARLVLLMRQKKALQNQAAEEREAADRLKALESIPLQPVTGDDGSNARPSDPLAIPAESTDASSSESGNSADTSRESNAVQNPSSGDGNSETREGAGDSGELATSDQNTSERPLTDRDGMAATAEDAAGMPDMSPEEFQANPISGPIDRLALATSLFATKQYAACLKVLEALDKETLSAESRDWCLYMMACCLRKQGELGEAESGYRTIVNKSETRWLVEASRWWLSHLNEQQKLTADLTQVNTTLDTWQKEIHAIKSSN